MPHNTEIPGLSDVTDKTLSERVAEVLAQLAPWINDADPGDVFAAAAEIIREQQAEIESMQKKLTASLGAADFWQEAETFRTTERDRLRAENEALLADAEAFRKMKERGPVAWIGKSSRSREEGDYRQLLQDYSASGGYGISAEYAADDGFSALYALPETKESGS